MELPTVETIGWITRGVLCIMCVATVCTLAFLHQPIDPILNSIMSGLLGVYAAKSTMGSGTSNITQPPPAPFRPSN